MKIQDRSTRRIRATVAAALSGAFLSGSQWVMAANADDQTLEEVVITGSRISRTDSETPSPVQLLSSEDIKQSGYTTISEVLQSITANGQGTLSNAFPGAFAGSATGISLRGLTTAATLVLVDGHRMAPFPLGDDGQRSFVDISSIPFDSVDRVEVLKDGASAVYGSDAMAGVVNIILKKKVTGFSGTAEGGSSSEGGGSTYHLAGTYGLGNLDSDGYNAYLAVEYRHSDHITQASRRGDGLWSSLDQTSIGGINQTPGVINDFNPNPPAYGTVFLTNGTYYPTAIGGANPNYSGACTAALHASGGCAFTNPWAEIQPKTSNFNVIGSLSSKLADDWSLDLKASLFESKGEQFRAGSTANGLITYPRSYTPTPAIGPGVVPHLNATSIPAITVPATYAGNTAGTASTVRGVMLDFPTAGNDQFDNKSYRLGVDVSGKIGGWTTDLAAGWSKVETKEDFLGVVDPYALFAALNSTTDPWLITGGNSAANRAAVFPTVTTKDTSDLYYVEAGISRSLAKLAGGDLGVSMGAEYIHRNLNALAPARCADGSLPCNDAFAVGSQTDTGVYAEIAAPVLSTLELDGHLRYDRYNAGLDATVPSVGFKWKPIPEFALRGTYGKGFRAPNPAENGQAGQAYSAGTSSDPLLCPGGGTAIGDVVAACHYNLAYINSANPNLKPEKSTSYTVGIIVQPWNAWETTVDYYQVDIKNQIVAGTGDVANAIRGTPVLSDCLSDPATGATTPCTPAVGPIAGIPVFYVNANSTKVNGFELDTKYSWTIGAGKLTTELDWSHMMHYYFTTGGTEYDLAGTHGPGVIGGNTGNPKDRAQGTIQWDKGVWQMRATLNWIGSFTLTDPAETNGVPAQTCADGVQNGGYFLPWFSSGQPTNPDYCKVTSFLDTDLTARYAVNDHVSVHGAITNLFNEQPPLDLNTYGGGNLPYNPSMHQVGAIGRFYTIGLTAKF